MLSSLFLARVFGIYFVVMGILMLSRRQQIVEAYHELMAHRGLVLISGAYSILFGAMVLGLHPRWVWSWQVILTILGLWAIAKGILLIGFFSEVKDFFAKRFEGNAFTVSACAVLAFGIWLVWLGFF